jgi:DNA (cytosine-5)-methyltransferase 1
MGLEDQHALGGGGLFVPQVMGTITTRTFTSLGARDVEEGCLLPVTHTLRAEGFDASEDAYSGRILPVPVVAPCLTQNYGKQPDNSDTNAGPMLVPVGFYPTNRQPEFGNYENISPAVKVGSGGSSGNPPAVAFDTTQITSKANYSNPQPGDPCHPLAAGAHPPAIATTMQVRRLTPRECERLQGFPDDHTLIPWRGKMAPDGPRYKALGNSMAVPVMRWIGERIAMIDNLKP